MEQRERDESSSKLEEALRELTGAETTGKIEEYGNEREGADVDSETACTDMRRAERMPAWRQEEDARKSKLSESRADVIKELNDDDWEQEELDELDEWDEPEKSPRGMGRLAAVFRPSDDLLAAFFLPVVILILIFAYRGIFPFGQESFLRTDMYHQYAPFFSEFRHKLFKWREPALQLGCRHGRKLCRALCVLSGEPVQLAAAVMPVVPDYRIYDLHDRVQERSGGSFDGVVSEKAHGFAEVWSVLFRRILCAVRLYGGV